MDRQTIYRKRLLFGIAGSLLFVFLGWYLFDTHDEQRALSPDIVKIIGIASMVFFGFAALIGIKKYLTK
jgi:hypothetical protein